MARFTFGQRSNAPMVKKQERKLKVLIAEAGSHYKIFEQIYHLLHDKCRLTFYIVEPKRYVAYVLMVKLGRYKGLVY